jgi:hypothetical protein
MVAATVVAVAFRSAQRALDRSAELVAARGNLEFSLLPFDPAAGQARNPGFEPVNAPAAFTCGAFLAGDLYLAGPGGLSIYAADGSLKRTLQTGIEFPVQPVVAMATGRLRGSNSTQLLLATAGAGVLLLEPNPRGVPTLRQLLPDQAGAADLTSLLPLASGDVLLGTRHDGVLIFDGRTLTPFDATAKEAREITALAAVDSTSFLIGTRNAGVFYVHAGTVQHADAATGMPDNQVEALAAANGKAFAGTPLGTAEFDLTAEAFRPSRVLAAGVFGHALAPDGRELLIGSLDQGIAQVPLDTRGRLRNAVFAPVPEQEGQRVDQFLAPAGSSGPLYALADGQLLARGRGGWTSALPAPLASLADRNISALAFAPDGSLYVGFFDHGLDIVSDSGVIHHLEDDHLFCVNRLVLDPQRGTMAAATADGLVLFDRQGMPRQTLTRRDGLISDHVTDVAFTRGGMTLATPAGITFVTPSGAESLYAFQGLVNNHVYTVATRNESLLAGTLGGISVLRGGAVERNLTVANSGLKHNWITALAPAPPSMGSGGWLVGTYGGGLMTLSADGTRFAPVELPTGAPRDLVINPNALLVTHEHIYAGTLAHGMLAFDERSGRWSVVTRGLPSLNVTAFAERDGVLYVGTENGLVRIAEDKLAAAGGVQ